MNDHIAVLIPAYNEEATILKVVDHCLRYTPHVFVVNDGSTDNTLSLLKNSAISLYSNATNQGKGAALLQGFTAIIEKNFQGVITLDADGQHNPDDLVRFIEMVEKNSQAFVIGARRFNTQHAPRIRLLANKIADFFISCAAKKRVCDTQSGFRYYPVSFLKQYFLQLPHATRFAFEAEILIAAAKMGLSFGYVDIESVYPDQARTSYYRPGKDSWEIAKSILKDLWR